jgi:hypothetical protein
MKVSQTKKNENFTTMDMKWNHISDWKLSPEFPQAPMPTILEKILTYLMHQKFNLAP